MSEIKPCPEITQADRNAAVRLLEAGGQDWQAKEIRIGDGDHFPIVQAFARHRSDACASVQRERDALREMLGEAIGYLHDIYGEDLCGDRTNAPSVKPRLYTTYIDWTTRYHVRAFLSRYEGEVK